MRLALIIGLAVVIVCCARGGPPAEHATITEAAVMSPAQGQISANGTYTVMAGYSLLEIKLNVVPDEQGGERGQAGCMNDARKLSWSGGPIEGLVSGTTYRVWAEITIYRNGNMTERYTYTSKQKQQQVN